MIFSRKLVDQYRKLKAEARGCILLMQVGAFMQAMDEDARVLSRSTGVKLQLAGEVDAGVVLGGFPASGLDAYIGRLVRGGSSVAVALQIEGKERRLVEIIRLRNDAPWKAGKTENNVHVVDREICPPEMESKMGDAGHGAL